MVAIPKNVMDLLAAPDAVKVIATVSADGQPHVIAAGTIGAVDPNTMMIGKVLTKVSADNIKSGKKVAFLVTKGLESYSINAVLKDIQSSGPVYDAVNQKLAGMHLHASELMFFDVTAVFNQGANPEAGKQIA